MSLLIIQKKSLIKFKAIISFSHKKALAVLLPFVFVLNIYGQPNNTYQLFSPDRTIKVDILIHSKIYYAVTVDGKNILKFSPLSLTTENKVLGEKPQIASIKKDSIRSVVTPINWYRSSIKDNYNQFTLNFKEGFSVVFRAYNEGIAYRFETHMKGSLVIKDEEVAYRFPTYAWGWFPEGETYETSWNYKQLFGLDKTKKIPLPLVLEPIEYNHDLKIAITEADVNDYPSVFLAKTPDMENDLEGVFEKYPVEFKQGGYNNYSLMPLKTTDFIAKTKGENIFPWRVMVITKSDLELVDNDLVYLLSRQTKLTNTSWIKPGQVAWDWWHDYNIENADFETGINTKTYLYHIDFAAKYNIPYINVDWLWSNPKDLFLLNPEVDIPYIIDYAKKKNVGVFLWCVSYTLDNQLQEVLNLFQKWGVAGIKVDFFDRDDQIANQMYERIASEAAKRKLMVNFHGSAKPTGLHRTYPNIVNYEAIKGSENNKWGTEITPQHDLNIPFIRQIAGPFDYTPGAMRNNAKGQYKVSYPPGAQGTRAHQLAMYVVYFEPLVMLSDMPTAYESEPEFTKFLTSIPTTWDETKILQGKLGEYIVIARRKDSTWYIGAMTNWTEREIELPLTFLEGGNHTATIYKDGVNSNKLATDYKVETQKVTEKDKITLNLKRGGGAVIRIQ